MAVRIKFDSDGNVIQPTFILCTRSGRKIGKIDATNIHIKDSLNSYFEVSFTSYKYNNDVESPMWDKIRDFKLAYCKEYDVYFELYVEKNQSNELIKNVSGVSLGEAELSQIMIYGMEVNTEDDISRDDYVATVLYDSSNSSASLLNRLLDKAPHYSIGHVDDSIKDIQRSFSFDNDSIYDAMQTIASEIDCIFVIDSGSYDGKPSRTINVYDLESYCVNCGTREEFTGECPNCGSTDILPGYGEDTTIFVSVENLADEITFETDNDSVKNCFKLEGGDDLMTAAIVNCNPNGSNYIWYISDEVRADMSEELQTKLSEYDTQYDYYVNNYEITLDSDIVAAYNEVINKYKANNEDLQEASNSVIGYSNLLALYYDTIDLYLYLNDSMMPTVESSSTNASEQADKLQSGSFNTIAVTNLSSASESTVKSAAISAAKGIVTSDYQVKVKTSSYNSDTHVWAGSFSLENYSDEEDTAETEEITATVTDDYQKYIEQLLNRSMADTDDATSITGLFALDDENFVAEIQKYNLTSLNSFADACQSCINILIEQGASDQTRWDSSAESIYDNLYTPYYNKLVYLQAEIKTRESEIYAVVGYTNSDGVLETSGLQTEFNKVNAQIQSELNFENFLGTALWKEFAAYRRDDTYENENYVSDGLDNKELVEKAQEFYEAAKKEIYKSATLQHTISTTLKNLMAMKDFEPLLDYFKVGNWIRVKVDDEVYRLRLISYEINYENLENISVDFSDVQRCYSGLSDAESIMSQASSMATSYGSVTRQAKQGRKGKEQLTNWVSKGLALTTVKIIDDAENQNVTWDEHGLLCRRMDDISGDYDKEQMKLFNKGLYFTNDNWATSKAAVGAFTFWNPETQQTEESYGVIADTLVGNLILSENVGVYNTENSVTLDEDGLTITADAGGNGKVMTVQRSSTDSSGNETIQKVMYLDADGNLVLTGSVHIQSGDNADISSIDDLCNDNRFYQIARAEISTESQKIYSSIDENFTTVKQYADEQLNSYKSDIGKYLDFNDDDGLVIGAKTSDFKTVIDNQGMYFKEGDSIVAYINDNQLYIESALIKSTLMIGGFMFSPHKDGSVSLTWGGDIE